MQEYGYMDIGQRNFTQRNEIKLSWVGNTPIQEKNNDNNSAEVHLKDC